VLFNQKTAKMKKNHIFLSVLFILIGTLSVNGQSNVRVSNPLAQEIMLGNYNPDDYIASEVIDNPDVIIQGLIDGISTDSLLSYLEKLDSFYQRNTGSDTVSDTRGIGATRRWIYQQFQDYSAASENRLIVSYLDFDQDVCGMDKHKNIIGVLPGRDLSKEKILLVEGHFDTRCEGGCDTTCYTPGIDDNGSGTVLVMELARVMSKFTFDHTIVFTPVTGEDQGLHGAKAMAKYIADNDIPFMACFNNDVVGGITCGATSSPPSCPGENHVDSLNVRLFSYSGSNDSTKVSRSKQLARYIKMNQEEKVNPLLSVPLNINIQIREDRSGRSGDHIPFRSRGWPAVRFCSQNEHGNGGGNPPDRQHSTRDILGIDTNGDDVIDSLFIDLNYLKRNAISNGANLALLGHSPPLPNLSPRNDYERVGDKVIVTLEGIDTTYQHRVGVRSRGSGTLYFDYILDFDASSVIEIDNLDRSKEYYFSVMNVEDGVPSLFPQEYTRRNLLGIDYPQLIPGINLHQNIPNPFTNSTLITIENSSQKEYNNVEIIVRDNLGRFLRRIPTYLGQGKNEIRLGEFDNLKGMLTYSLVMEGKIIDTKRMIKVN